MHFYADGSGRAGLACDPEKLSAGWGILSPFHSKLCGIVGASRGLNTKRGCFHMDFSKTGSIRDIEILFTPGHISDGGLHGLGVATGTFGRNMDG